MSADKRKKILFFPLNSPGHINSSLGIADKLKQDFNYETVFLVIGDTIGNTIVEHGHQLIMLEETNIYEDYEISSDEDTMKPLDEEAAIKKGKKKVKFLGCKKWPQIILRHQYLVRLPPLESFIKTLTVFEKSMVQDLIDSFEGSKRAIEEIKPDLIVVDSYYISPAILDYKACPWIRLYSACPLGIFESKLPDGVKIASMIGNRLYNKEKRLQMRKENPKDWEELVGDWKKSNDLIVEGMQKCGNSYGDYLELLGCPPVPFGKQTHDSPHLNLYMYPKELDFDMDDDILECPPRWFRCDSLLRDDKNADNKSKQISKEWEDKFEKAMQGKKASIFFSLGSIASGDFKTMRKYIEMFSKDQERLYVVSKGINGHKYELDKNNMIGGNFIPQTLFLQKVDLAIIHGGNNSVTECFFYGVPVIVLPAFADQIDNAQRVEDLGLGKKLVTYDFDEDATFKAIDEILANKELIQRCKQIGEQMRTRNDAVKASLLVKKLVEEGKLEQSFIDECRDKDANEIQW